MVGVVTTDLGNDMVATGVVIPVAFVMFTVAVGVVGETAVQALVSDVPGAPVMAMPGGEWVDSLALVWPVVVTVDDATVVTLSKVTGEVVVAAVMGEETVQ